MTSYNHISIYETHILMICVNSHKLVHMLVETRSVAHEIAFMGSKSQKIYERAHMSMS